MSSDLRPGPDSPPADELRAAEAALGVLQHILHPISRHDWSKQTASDEFDVAQLTDHLVNTIILIGDAAGCGSSAARRRRHASSVRSSPSAGPRWTPSTSPWVGRHCELARQRDTRADAGGRSGIRAAGARLGLRRGDRTAAGRRRSRWPTMSWGSPRRSSPPIAARTGGSVNPSSRRTEPAPSSG